MIILAPPDPAAAVRASIERELPVQGVELLREEVPDGRIAVVVRLGRIRDRHDVPTDGARVLVDGRNDMYSEEILNEYNEVKNAEPGWEAIIDGYDVDALLFPPSSRSPRGRPRMPAGARRTATTTRSSTCAVLRAKLVEQYRIASSLWYAATLAAARAPAADGTVRDRCRE